MDGYNDDQPPPDDEHAFFVENDSGAVQISVDYHLETTHAAWRAYRRTSDGSDSEWSFVSEFAGMTASSLDENPFTDDDSDSIVSFDPTAHSSVNSQSHYFVHEDSSALNLADVHPDGDGYSLPTNPSFLPQSHSSFHGPSSNVTASSPSSEYASPGDSSFLHVPLQHRLERRNSDSMGWPSHPRMHHRNRSESQLSGVQGTTLIQERSNNFVVPQEATNTVGENFGSVSQYRYDHSSGTTVLPASTSPSFIPHPQSYLHRESLNGASEQTLAVPSDFHDHGASRLQLPSSHGKAPGMVRRHSSSDLGAHSPYPNLHRPRRPSESSVLAQQFSNLHVDGQQAHLSPTTLSPSSSSDYASPSEPTFLDVPPQRRLERRHSDSMGRPLQESTMYAHYQNLSESQLGMQATASIDTFAVPQEATNAADNAMGGSQYDGRFSDSALPGGASWPVPSTGLSSAGQDTWDGETHLPVEGHRMTGHFDIQTHGYANLSTVYNAEGQHCEGLSPSHSPEDYRSPFDEFGGVCQSRNTSQQSYKSLTVSSPQDLLNGDRVDNNQFAISFGERVRPGYVPTFMGVDPPPQEAPPALSSNAGTGSQPVEPSLHIQKRPRRKRKHDPKAVEKMRWKNKVAWFFCDLCPTVSSFTIKGAFVRHMRETHGGLPPPACHLCDKTYSHQTSLQRHLRNDHGPKGKAVKPRALKT